MNSKILRNYCIKESTLRNNCFYKKNIFITGATGFLGKVFFTRILKKEPNKIYTLIRNKKNENSRERFNSLISQSLCYKNLKEELNIKSEINSFFNHKFSIIEGDISKTDLGISVEDLTELKDKVDIVINLGASISWKENFPEMHKANYQSLFYAMDIAKKAKAKLFIHVSSIGAVKPYHMLYNQNFMGDNFCYENYINKVNKMNEEEAEKELNLLHENLLTTYTFTKACSERLIELTHGDSSTVIIQCPSIGPAYFDPEPGWLDNITGTTGNYFYIGLNKALAYHLNISTDHCEMPVWLIISIIFHSNIMIKRNLKK